MTEAAGKPSLSPTESERVKKALERLYARFGHNATELGRQIGRSQPAVTLLLNGTNQASLETARRIAKLEGVPVTSYLDGTAQEPLKEEAGEFPSKVRAARAARELSLADWAIEQMLTEAAPEGLKSDPGAVFWFRRVEQLLAAVGPGIEPNSGASSVRGGVRRGRRGRRRP